MPLRTSGNSSPPCQYRSGMRRRTPWCAPRNSKVMSSRTSRLPSVLTSTLVTKVSIESRPRVCADAGAAPARTSARSRTMRPMRSAPEGDARDLAVFGTVELEIPPLGEPEEQRDLVGGKAVDRRVEVADDRVVVAARALDRVLDLLERRLEVAEVLVGLEVGIRLGEREELAERARQLVLGLGPRLGRLRRDGRAPRAHDLVERGPLVPGIALHRLDHVGHEIGPPFQLDVDVRPRLLRPLTQPDELVVPGDDRYDQKGEDEEENDATEPHECLLKPL